MAAGKNRRARRPLRRRLGSAPGFLDGQTLRRGVRLGVFFAEPAGTGSVIATRPAAFIADAPTGPGGERICGLGGSRGQTIAARAL
ncbi:hypothetical protein [Streptomyces sp. NPDC055642]